MRHLKFILIILSTIFVNSLFGQQLTDTQNKLITIVKDIRSEYNLEEMKYDTSLINALQELNQIDLFKTNKISKNHIRKILQQNFCYDYNFEVVKIEISENEILLRKDLSNKQDLLEILKNKDYNNYCILQDINNSKIVFIATMKYIHFNRMSKKKPASKTSERYIYQISTKEEEIYIDIFKYIFDAEKHMNNLTYSHKKVKETFGKDENGETIYPYTTTITMSPVYKSCVIYNKYGKILTIIPLYMITGDTK